MVGVQIACLRDQTPSSLQVHQQLVVQRKNRAFDFRAQAVKSWTPSFAYRGISWMLRIGRVDGIAQSQVPPAPHSLHRHCENPVSQEEEGGVELRLHLSDPRLPDLLLLLLLLLPLRLLPH